MEIDEQVQMYAHNRLLDHPLVSPVNQGSLGGLPPLYVVSRAILSPSLAEGKGKADLRDLRRAQCCGGSELLHDEIIYIAHKGTLSPLPSSLLPIPANPPLRSRQSNLLPTRPTNLHPIPLPAQTLRHALSAYESPVTGV